MTSPITLAQVLPLANFKITEGSPYLWNSFGQSARWLDLDDDDLNVHLSLIHDTDSDLVYSAYLEVGALNKFFRWVNPLFKQAYLDEHFDKEIDPRYATDADKYIDCEETADILNKIETAFKTGTCNTSVSLSLDLSDDLSAQLAGLPEEEIQEIVVGAIKAEVDAAWVKAEEKWNVLKLKASADLNLDITLAEQGSEKLGLLSLPEAAALEWLKNLVGMQSVSLRISDRLTKKGLKYTLVVETDTPVNEPLTWQT